jgi:ATPase subunit of ABC transporter with duplicated ATPase domains
MKLLRAEVKARAAVELFYNNVQATKGNYEVFEQELKTLNEFLQIHANKRNNRTHKVMTAFVQYFNTEAKKKRKIEQIEKIAKGKRLSYKESYKDYLEEFLILRKRQYSYRAISDYAKKHFKIKVSKDTIRNFLKEYE